MPVPNVSSEPYVCSTPFLSKTDADRAKLILQGVFEHYFKVVPQYEGSSIHRITAQSWTRHGRLSKAQREILHYSIKCIWHAINP